MYRIATISVAATALLLSLGTSAFAAKTSTSQHAPRYARYNADPLHASAGVDCSLNTVIGSQDYCVGTDVIHYARRPHG